MNSGFPSRLESTVDVSPEARLEQLQLQLQRLERRDWWLWAVAIVVMTLLTVAIFSMSFPGLLAATDSIFEQNLDRAVKGLAALVMLFNFYSIYQQSTIKRTRKQLSEQLEEAKQYYKQATTDSLTGLSNRRTAEDYLLREMARARRRKSPLTVVAFDLNNFKQVNDRYGHAAGDEMLRTFAKKLLYKRRAEDMAVRMGGDEFLLLLPECPAEQVKMLLDRLHPCEANWQSKTLPVEFAAGMASYDLTETRAQLLERADKDLYKNKREGKQGPVREPVMA